MTLTVYYGNKTPIKAVGANQCRLLDFALVYKGWHTMRGDRATMRAVSALHRKGCLEVKGDQFRFCYPK